MLFQSLGGLQVQVLETIAALTEQGCNARLIDPSREKLDSFDLVHVFSVINGNHRIIERAHAFNLPVVVSPLVRPYWTRALARRADLMDRLMGRLTAWNVTTEYHQLRSGLKLAARCVALGGAESTALQEAFGVASEQIDIVPNGIPSRFFAADPAPFLQAYNLHGGFALCVASIDPHKNQLGLAKALSAIKVPLVLIGECRSDQRDYLRQVLEFPDVRYIGSMQYNDALLPSAYAAAGAMCLPSMSEVMPLSVLESLAAGRPAIMTKNHCMDMDGMRECILEIDPFSHSAISHAVQAVLANPPPTSTCRLAVRHLTWAAVATRLLRCYEQALASKYDVSSTI